MPKASNDNRPPYGRAWWSAMPGDEAADARRNDAACRRLGRIAASRLRDLAALGIPVDVARRQVMSLLGLTDREFNGYVARHRDAAVARRDQRRLAFTRIWRDRGMADTDIAVRLGLSEIELRALLRHSNKDADGGA